MVPIRPVPASLIRTFAALSLLAGAAAEGARREAPIATGDPWLDRMAAYYEAHPELKDLPGSGWKPYNRIRWEHGITVVDGVRPEPGARWLAWREKMERFPGGGEPQPRSAWFQLGPENLAGRMLALAFHPNDPNTIYGGAAGGGLWKTTDEGATWTPLGDNLPTMAVSGVALSLTNPDIVVIATGELPGGIVDGIAGVGILRSTDGGQTFATTSLSYPLIQDHGFHIVEAGPNGTILAGAVDGLWRSSDDGQTWTQVIVGGDYYDVKWKPGDPNTVFTVKGNDTAGNKVKISTDDGLTFENAGTGQPPSFDIGKSKIALTAANPQYVYALYANKQGDGTTGLWRTTDGGATWQARNTSVNVGGAQGWYNLSLAADPNNAERVIAGGVQLYRSGDGGTTLATIGGGVVHVDHHDARYQPGSPNDVWVACDGGIWESTSDGASGSWAGKNQGLVTYQFYDVCAAESDPVRMAGGTQDNGTDVRTGSNIWSQGLGGDGMVCNIDPTNRDIIYAESQFGELRKSTNGGSSWFDIDAPGTGLWVAPVDIDRNNPLHLYMCKAGDPGGIYRTTNGGTSWTQVHPLGARSISISPANGVVVWGLDATALYTTDDGATWNSAAAFPFPTGGVLRILAHPTIPGGALCSFAGYVPTQAKVAYTSDFGVTWSNVTGDLPSIPVRGLAIDPQLPDHWYLGTDVAVWVSTNGGTNWTPYATGIPQAVIWDIEIQESARKLVAGTHGRGAWEVDLLPLSTSAPEIARSLEIMLDPPAPNPVRGQEVVLRWASKRAGPVTLDVYDVGGRLVTRVDERSHGDGIIRTSAWVLDSVPAGVYFAVLDAGGERLSRKVVVLE